MGWAGYRRLAAVQRDTREGGRLPRSPATPTQVVADTEHLLDKGAAMATTFAAYDRRMDDWKLQHDLAAKEIEQLDRSIDAAQLRVDHRPAGARRAPACRSPTPEQSTSSCAPSTPPRSSTTGTSARSRASTSRATSSPTTWPGRRSAASASSSASQTAATSGSDTGTTSRRGSWPSETLQHDLRRLEAGYREQNRREFELTKHVSLRLLDPDALVRLRETGRCFFSLPEEIFDLDYPGHYFRRIKSVSLTLPCVAGPYTTISCTLRLLKNSVRVTTRRPSSYARNADGHGLPTDDDRFIETNIPVKAIAASGAQNDAGVFELNFRDDRYLPFEGAGAVSGWQLELFTDMPRSNGKPPGQAEPDFGRSLRQFDYDTISDVVLHVKYTAREDAGGFKSAAIQHLRSYFNQPDAQSAIFMLDWRHDFPGEWSRFLNPAKPADGNVFELELTPNLLPIRDQSEAITVDQITMLARCSQHGDYTVTLAPPDPPPGAAAPPAPPTKTLSRNDDVAYGHLHHTTWPASDQHPVMAIDPAGSAQAWRIRMKGPGGADLAKEPVDVQDVIMILTYQRG